MQSQIDNIGYVTENRAIDIISKVGSLAMVGEIGVSRKEVSNFFGVSTKTISRILKSNSLEFKKYGVYLRSANYIREFAGDESVHCKTRDMYLFNRKHIMLFACHLSQTSDVAKRIIQYLIQVESNATKEDKMTAIFEQLIKWDELPDDCKTNVYMQGLNAVRESKGLIAFAESVGECASLISINDFAKTTYGTLGLGQKKLFQEMRFNGILSSQNRPYQCYLDRGYFEVVTRVINGKVIYQPMLTGRGEVFLFKKMKKLLGI